MILQQILLAQYLNKKIIYQSLYINKKIEKYYILILFLLSAFFYTYRLGSHDLVLWDESYYSYRTLDVLYNHNWIDQIENPNISFWIGTHPPMITWAMAVSCEIFGINEFGMRLPAAFCGVICILLVYSLVLLLTKNKNISIISALILLFTPYFKLLTCMAQLDVPVLMFILLSITLYLKSKEGKRNYLLFAAAAFGLSMMSKIIVGLLVPLIIFAFIMILIFKKYKSVKNYIKELSILVLIGLILSLPWYIFIINKWGLLFWDEYFNYHVLQRMSNGVEGHVSVLGVLYYPLELVKDMNFFFPFAVFGMIKSFNSELISTKNKYFLTCMFLVPFAIFSLSQTKFYTYTLLFLIPLVVYSGFGIYYFLKDELSSFKTSLIIITAISCFIWSKNSILVNDFENIFKSLRMFQLPVSSNLIPLLYFMLLSIVVIIIVNYLLKIPFLYGIPIKFILFLFFVAIPSVYFFLSYSFESRTGWKDTRDLIVNDPKNSYRIYAENNELNRYYTEVINHDRIINKIQFTDLRSLDTLNNRIQKEKSNDILVVERGNDIKNIYGYHENKDIHNDRFIFYKKD